MGHLGFHSHFPLTPLAALTCETLTAVTFGGKLLALRDGLQLMCLLDLPKGNRVIGSKWDFRNKKDERGIVVRNKARLVAQGHTQEEGIDYEEVLTPVARIKAIMLFLAYASFMGFMVYQMDVKSAFLYGTIEEEVYVCQPLGFEDLDYPDKVYKVVKALYGLHQAPRAWYETLANYLLENGFQRGKIYQTLFIKNQKGNILLVQVYVDDIIFGSTNKELCKAFEKLMKDKFQMSSMGELTFFLGLQVKPKDNGIFISQDKYVAEILRKFSLTDGKSASTPIDTENPLLKNPDGEEVNVHIYRSMIGSLMYLTSSRLDIMFAVCACTRFQVTLKVSHLHAVKRIFRLIINAVSSKLMFSGLTIDAAHLMLLGHKDVKEAAEDEDDANEVSVERTPPLPTPATTPPPPTHEHIPSPSPTQEHIPSPPQVQIAQPSLPPPPQPSQTIDISMTLLNTLLETCATLTKQVANLEQDKVAQAIEITKLKQRVRRRMHPNRGEIAELDVDEDVTLVDAEVEVDANVQGRLVESQSKVVTTAATTITVAQVPKASAPKRRRGVVIQDAEETASASVIVHFEVKSKDKGKEDELNANINWNDVMGQVKKKEKQDNTVMRYQALKRKPVTKAQMILLVETKYPLIRFTLEQTLNNVRLKVEEESEMSLELLSFGVDPVEDFKKIC
nr:putative ribonuclease H-like domain-containing protein [Tanacetum cinerariifolium]